MTIDNCLPSISDKLIGKPCCRQRIGNGRSFSIGFGEKIPNKKQKIIDSFYGEWELGTYSSTWRVVRNNEIIFGSLDVVDSINELDRALQAIKFGAVSSIDMLSNFDIRVNLDNGIALDFLCATNDNDEIFHIFGPEKTYVEYSFLEGWKIGKSDLPWPTPA